MRDHLQKSIAKIKQDKERLLITRLANKKLTMKMVKNVLPRSVTSKVNVDTSKWLKDRQRDEVKKIEAEVIRAKEMYAITITDLLKRAKELEIAECV